MANDKLKAVVACTSRIQLMTEGGWQYSSPLVRESGGEEVPLLDTPDALSIVALIAGDLEMLANELGALLDESKSLGIDPVAMCGVDVAAQARIYQQLSQSVAVAARQAVEAFQEAPKPERKRGRSLGRGNGNTSATDSRQCKLSTIDDDQFESPANSQ